MDRKKLVTAISCPLLAGIVLSSFISMHPGNLDNVQVVRTVQSTQSASIFHPANSAVPMPDMVRTFTFPSTASQRSIYTGAAGRSNRRLVGSINSSSTQGSVYTPLTPYRIVDTRSGATDPSTYAGDTLGANSTLNVQVSGVSGPQGQSVPSGASAVVLTVTALPTSSTVAGGYLSVYPEGGSLPSVSNLNFGPGQIVNNTVTVALSSSGGISIYNFNGSTNVLVNVDGYYATPSVVPATAGLYNAVSPTRVLDTRTGSPFGALGANTTEEVSVTGGSTGIPTTATAVVANITAIGTSSTVPGGYVTAWPSGATMPDTSILNISSPTPL